jgi:hypothetical protein
MAEIVTLPTLIDEETAYTKYGEFLRDKELRRARQSGEIGFYRGKKKIRYDEAELLAFIGRRLKKVYQPCQQKPGDPAHPSSSSGAIGSSGSPGATVSTDPGMTPELARSAAERLVRRISKKPSSDSPRSSRTKAARRAVGNLPTSP